MVALPLISNLAFAVTFPIVTSPPSGWNDKGNGSNISGFTGLPGGYRFDNGGFVDVGSFGYWWSLEGNKTGLAWHKSLIRLSREDLNDYGRIGFLKEGLSVRCIKD